MQSECIAQLCLIGIILLMIITNVVECFWIALLMKSIVLQRILIKCLMNYIALRKISIVVRCNSIK